MAWGHAFLSPGQQSKADDEADEKSKARHYTSQSRDVHADFQARPILRIAVEIPAQANAGKYGSIERQQAGMPIGSTILPIISLLAACSPGLAPGWDDKELRTGGWPSLRRVPHPCAFFCARVGLHECQSPRGFDLQGRGNSCFQRARLD